MKILSSKNKLFYPLLTAVIIIWGIIISELINYVYTEDTSIEILEEPALIKKKLVKSSDTLNYSFLEYEKLNREPFLFYKPIVKKPKKKVKSVIEKKEFDIKYTINGVILNRNSRVVIIEILNENKTLFMREGEIFNRLKIVKITNKMVTVSEDGNKKDIELK